jgi:hypothetical protein
VIIIGIIVSSYSGKKAFLEIVVEIKEGATSEVIQEVRIRSPGSKF